MINRRWTRFAGLVLAAFVGSASVAQSAEYYYVIIFGSQSKPKQLRYSHTWATFVKLTGEGPDLNTYATEINTISWYPASRDVRVWDLHPEQGVNLELFDTINEVYKNHESITAWGPFFVRKELYDRSVAVSNVLASGRANYRAISGRMILTGDCIHAVAAVDPVFGRNHYPLIRIGKPASRYIARQVMTRSVYDQTQFDNSWLIPRLGLDQYPIEVIPAQRIPKQICLFCQCPE